MVPLFVVNGVGNLASTRWTALKRISTAFRKGKRFVEPDYSEAERSDDGLFYSNLQSTG